MVDILKTLYARNTQRHNNNVLVKIAPICKWYKKPPIQNVGEECGSDFYFSSIDNVCKQI